jgi:uncharacterized protein (TIGR00730 family)
MIELHFTRTNGAADEAIDRLMELVGDVHDPDIVREMILASLKAGQEDGDRTDLKFMNVALKEMRFTTKVFSPYRQVKKVTVFGSARTNADDPLYKTARLLGERLSEAGYMVITGGGPGIMQAVNEGAGPERSFGINIRLPFEQKANPIVAGNPRSITYKFFFNRKVAFLKEAHAIVVFPGGFGTLDEAMESLTLVQTGKRQPIPLVLVDEPGGTYWAEWMTFFEKELLPNGYVGSGDLDLFERVESVDAALAIIDRFYYRYHSLRYVGDKLVIRLTSPIHPLHVEHLRVRFADILAENGGFSLSGPWKEEADEPDLAHLPRLVVDFNRKDFGGLRKLIDAINGL